MAVREGNLEAPKREPIAWRETVFTDPNAVDAELERVFDICHGCRRCVNLCNAFPTLFDLIDESDTFEVDGVAKEDYEKVVDECYLCDLCAETKCPYLPPHEWAVDFPHLMLRAKARYLKEKSPKLSQRILTSTEPLFRSASTPGVAPVVNSLLSNKTVRSLSDKLNLVHRNAPVPKFESQRTAKRMKSSVSSQPIKPAVRERKVAIYVTCYGEAFSPDVIVDLYKLLTHNDVETCLLPDTHCCGMPKFELGDLHAVAARKDQNLPVFLEAIDNGYDIVSTVPSCTLMYRQEIPLLFPEDEQVRRVQEAFKDPFEYLHDLHRSEELKLDFQNALGRVTYHAACHQRVQNIGQKTKTVLNLIPDSEVEVLERCSGHGGTYAIRKETYPAAAKIARPVARKLRQSNPDVFGSDCPIAGNMIVHETGEDIHIEHPISMMARAYGLNES